MSWDLQKQFRESQSKRQNYGVLTVTLFLTICDRLLLNYNKEQLAMQESNQLFLDESQGINLDHALRFDDLRREPPQDRLFPEENPHCQNDQDDQHISKLKEKPEIQTRKTLGPHEDGKREPKRDHRSSHLSKESQSDWQKVIQRPRKTRPKAPRKHYYDKNICGYITKKVIREFLGRTYEIQALQFAQQCGCDLRQCRSYYQEKLQWITGPRHMPPLFRHHSDDTAQLSAFKRAFSLFFDWFLRQRYLRHLVSEGKMMNKSAYIDYKNKYLVGYALQLDEEDEQQMKDDSSQE